MSFWTKCNRKYVVLAVVIILGITACFAGYYIWNKPVREVADNTLYVKTIKVSEAVKGAMNTYPGVVKGRYETNLSFQVGGRIISKQVQMGQYVNAGQVLMTLDSKDLEDNLAGAQAQVSAAKSQMDLASSTLVRYRKLYRENAVSAQTLDQMETNYRAAVAAYNQAQSQASRSQTAVGYSELRATSSGVISQVMGEVGQVVGAGQPVATFVKNGSLEVEIAVPENKLAEISINKPATVTFWALNKLKVDGVVREISPMADSVARTYKVKIALATIPPQVKLGMTANVELSGEHSTAITLPLSALYQTGKQTQVWLVKTVADGTKTVELHAIKVVQMSDNDIEVTGLPEDSIVVIAGVNKLSAGAKVKLMDGDN